MKQIISGLALLITTSCCAQLTVTAYAELYYSYDFDKPTDNNKAGYIYSHNRHNEFNLNLGYIKAAYTANVVRANLAIAAGTYMNANYAAEPGVLKNIYEANAGIKLSKKKNLWLDAGIFGSHIGFEGAVSKDCWTLTRSLVAENSPYYESGAKITYTSDNNKWLFSALALNGWQRIKRVEGNSLMSVGTQVQFKPNEHTTFNYSTFIGTDKPDSARQMRYFHNLYAIVNIDKLGITTGFDIGTEGSATCYSPVVILKYTIGEKWAVAGRGEYYNDEDGVIIGDKIKGYSFNIDYSPTNNALLRIESRQIKKTTMVTSSIAINF